MGRHPIKVAYPTSLAMVDAGFIDAWRVFYPDEMEYPGYTCSSFYEFDDPSTHHDRIDFIYYRGGGVQLNDVKVIGENHADADIVVTPYPSDHQAVVASFMLTGKQEK